MRANANQDERERGPARDTKSDVHLPERVLERVSDGVVALDKEGRYTYVNEQAARILGKPVCELLGCSLWALFPELIDQPFTSAYRRALDTQEVTYVESYYPPWDRWFENRIYPANDGFSVFFHDVSDRKRAEALLIGQSQVLELIAHGADLPTVLTTLLRLIESQWTGMRSSILLLDADGQRLRHGAAPSLPAAFIEAIDGASIGPTAGACGAAAYRREPVVIDDIETHPNWHEWKHLALPLGLRACCSSPIFDEQQKVLGTFAIYYPEPYPCGEPPQHLVHLATHLAQIAICHDRAQRARLEQERVREKNRELEECNRLAQEASRLKSEFLANMSHELRTPLNAIVGFSEYLSDELAGPLNAKQLECLGHVLTSGRHLLRLINDVLDLAKVEAGKLELFPVEFELCELLEEVCSVARALAEEKEIAVALQCDPKLERVTLDPQKLRQVLFNLLANAVKFTPEGGQVEVTALALADGQLEVRVRDNGIGIRREDLSALFQKFRQLDAGSGRHHEGTGLGLALAKRLVECQRGRIGVESQVDVGSTFYVVLPRVLPTDRGKLGA
jgi:PAS domain S-box-containing protein